MSLFKRTRSIGLMNEIRCDEPSYLIWKWHPAGTQQGNNVRENAIRWGSSLRVKDGEVAVFVYNQKNGIVQDFIVGPFDDILETNNLPVLARVIGLAYSGGTPFPAEVYFINMSHIVQTKLVVPFFDVFDSNILGFGVPVAVRGTITFRISDCREFVALHRLNSFDLEGFQMQIRDAVSRYVKEVVANAPTTYNISVIQLESKIAAINDAIEGQLKKRLLENFGVDVSGVDVGTIEIDKTSEEYKLYLEKLRETTFG